MDYRTADDSGGTDGCIYLQDADNKGLADCTIESTIQDVYADWCDLVSLADFFVIAAEAVMARTATDHDERDRFKSGSLASNFMSDFRFGRETLVECPDHTGRMPDAELGCETVEDIFVNEIFGASSGAWSRAAALMGVHTLGSAKLENSGYLGHWSDEENQGVFNNNYYLSFFAKGWGPELAVGGDDNRNQWKRIDLMAGVNDEMMLTTDLCLAYQNNYDF